MNRRAFELALEDAVSASRRAADHGALCFIDLDRFKSVNDECGHAAGDALLREIAELIRNRVRTQDLICRVGGDEFALILRACTADDAKRIAQNLCDAVAAHCFDWGGDCFHVSASVGLARIDDAVLSTNDVLQAADSACYSAKHKGRNQVVEYNPRFSA
jgi:diguanylate cyclase (GGDEF)-like protein